MATTTTRRCTLPYSTCKHNYVKDSEDEGEDTEIVSTHTRTYAEDIEEERDRKEREGATARPGGRPERVGVVTAGRWPGLARINSLE